MAGLGVGAVTASDIAVGAFVAAGSDDEVAVASVAACFGSEAFAGFCAEVDIFACGCADFGVLAGAWAGFELVAVFCAFAVVVAFVGAARGPLAPSVAVADVAARADDDFTVDTGRWVGGDLAVGN